MSQFEAALDDYRQKYPQISVRDKITGSGRRIITEKGPDGIAHKCFIHENRNSKARARLSEKYHQRKQFDIEKFSNAESADFHIIGRFRIDLRDICGGNEINLSLKNSRVANRHLFILNKM